MTHLWEARHPYRCEEGCYYSRHDQSHTDHDSWQEFVEEMGDIDFDYNLLFRWDWYIANDDDDHCQPSDNKDDRDGELHLRFMLQRKASPWSCTIKVCQNDEPAVREFLQQAFNHLLALWVPVEKQP